MSRNIASCGHLIRFKYIFRNTVHVRALARDGSHAAKYLTLCNRCLLGARLRRLVLKDEKAVRQWLSSTGGKEKVW